MKRAHLPLYPLFLQLRSRGFDLGLESYDWMLQLLADVQWTGSLGEPLREQLFRICKTLWYKPNQSLEVFEEVFEQYWQSRLREWRQPHETTAPETPQPAETRTETGDPSRREQPEETPQQELPGELPEDIQESEADEADDQTHMPARADKFIYLQPQTDGSGEYQLGESEGTNESGPKMPSGPVSQQFLFKGAYNPIAHRDMQISWRYLRTEYHKVPGEELDLEATIRTFFRSGLFTPVYRKQKNYYARLMVLVDHGGSMVAFEGFSRKVLEMAPLGQFGQLPSVYYFRNVPGETLFDAPAHQKGYRMRELAGRFRQKKTEVLIISDAGAARGYTNELRVFQTKQALRQIRQFANRIVWLNPLPEHRWWDTSAEAIAALPGCQMFEASPYALNRAVDVLRGKKNVRGKRGV